jgi:hypothetical protein
VETTLDPSLEVKRTLGEEEGMGDWIGFLIISRVFLEETMVSGAVQLIYWRAAF